MILLALVAHADDAAFAQLRAPEATASSFLKSNWNAFTENYHPSYILDGDPKTAWVEGATGSGAGEWIGWDVSGVQQVRRVKVRLRNGYQKTDGLLTANAAPAKLTVTLTHAGRPVHTAPWTLTRSMGWQDLVLDPPADIAFDGIRLQVDAVTEGKTYADLCISDAEVWVDAGTAYNAVVENAKHQAALAWIQERKADAAYFASKPKAYPFTSTHFRGTWDEQVPASDALAFEAAVTAGMVRADALLTSPTFYRVDVRDPVRPPEGLSMPDLLLPLFSPGVTFFEAQTEWRPTTSHGNEIGSWTGERTMTNVKRTEDGTKGELAFRVRQVIEERSTITTNSRWWVQTEGGRVIRAVSTGYDDGGEGCDSWESAEIWDFTWTGDAVSAVDRRHRYRCGRSDEPDPEYHAPRYSRSAYRAEPAG